MSLAVGLGCLLAAGHVLSSVDMTPTRAAPFPAEFLADGPQFRDVLPVRHFHPGPRVRPVQANVQLQGAVLQITNASRETWRDVRVQIGSLSEARTPVYRLARLGPFETRRVSLLDWQTSPDIIDTCPFPLYVRWHCRTGRGGGAWLGYAPGWTNPPGLSVGRRFPRDGSPVPITAGTPHFRPRLRIVAAPPERISRAF